MLWVGPHAGAHGASRPQGDSREGVGGPVAQYSQVVGEVPLVQGQQVPRMIDEGGVGSALAIAGGAQHAQHAFKGLEEEEEGAEEEVAQVTQLCVSVCVWGGNTRVGGVHDCCQWCT